MILTERKYDTSDLSWETSSDSDALDFDLEVEESWRARLANFITEIHAYADELLAEEEWLKITKVKWKKTRNKRTTFKEDSTPQSKGIHCELRDYSAAAVLRTNSLRYDTALLRHHRLFAFTISAGDMVCWMI